ncbi:ABC transporter substrate-binding protein [Candidatus Roizmanbacteria bacterium]|nr:ABC transporter substrate-binding protein [Candidatus Roizmanbacteria bacterium]
MTISKKTFRYYYWLTIEFIKKHLKIILLSFLLSFIIIISLISFSPYIQTLLLTKKDIIGLVGDYDLNTIPDEVTNKISNGLLFINEKGEFVPAVASTWETSDDGKEYRFHIRDGLIWSNGKKFSAYDIPYQFKDIETKVIDDKTIYFRLKNSLPIFPTYLKKPIIRSPLVGVAGLYKVDRIKSRFGSIVELSLSPNKKDLPFIVYKFYKSETELVNAYKSSKINQMIISKKSLADIFQKWKNTSVIKSVDYTRLLTLFFNLSNQILKQKEVRQAMTQAIDKSQFRDLGEIALGPITPISWAYSLNLKNPVFDQSAAEKNLKKTISSSESAQLNFFSYYDYLNYAEQIAQNLKDVGLTLNLKLLSSDKPNNFDLFLAFWNVPPDPDQYFFWHSTQSQGNLGGYKNLKIDKLLEDGRNTSSLEERKKFYEEFQKILADDPPAVFLYFPYVYTIKRK